MSGIAGIGLVLLLSLLLLTPAPAYAHGLQPAYLEMIEEAPGEFDVSWKVPTLGEEIPMQLELNPQLPSNCQELQPRSSYAVSGASLYRWRVGCGEDGLVGKTITIEGLKDTVVNTLLRLEFANGQVRSAIARPNSPSYIIPGAEENSRFTWSYLRLGVEHIFSGIDHLLFVLGLVLIVRGTWLLFKTITAFTLAHSMTLGAATLGLVKIPQTPVEAVIALSILFLAAELAHSRQGKPGLTEKSPWLVALTFGLLHGFGFAGALTEVGIPQAEIPLALLLFNVGVEIGQVVFVLSVLGLRWGVRQLDVSWPQWLKWLPPYAIGSVSAFWCLQRVSAFW
ncbi:hypothetical protein BJP34_17340 [Moorena producens PAL-8-15-08-1]|uniref:HupE / UreJ protein n=1 Tax=Moorena producens PAL-8-15-08-1 TaxID=1458985 RepID=A0A1D8U3L7_9CYAN|nr:hypothetical protein BJP34_17340 [Moorena producens PAL-8-15-08-1]